MKSQIDNLNLQNNITHLHGTTNQYLDALRTLHSDIKWASQFGPTHNKDIKYTVMYVIHAYRSMIIDCDKVYNDSFGLDFYSTKVT